MTHKTHFLVAKPNQEISSNDCLFLSFFNIRIQYIWDAFCQLIQININQIKDEQMNNRTLLNHKTNNLQLLAFMALSKKSL